MPSLKEYRNRIASVKSTRKITSAMKMVAASKLRRAQSQAEASQPYANKMKEMLSRLVGSVDNTSGPFLMSGNGKDDRHLLVMITSDRGLCGGFNSYVARKARDKIRELLAGGKEVKVICVGRKGRDALKSEFGSHIIEGFEGLGRKRLTFAEVQQVSNLVLSMAEAEEFDVCSIIYNRFESVMTQTPTAQQLVPLVVEDVEEESEEESKAVYIFEPEEEALLKTLLPRNLAVQLFSAVLDSAAGEQAARMTAMDNATRNAGDMIDQLTLSYNRARQAYITTELIEIIAGAEAV